MYGRCLSLFHKLLCVIKPTPLISCLQLISLTSITNASPYCLNGTIVPIDYIWHINPFTMNVCNGLCNRSRRNEVRFVIGSILASGCSMVSPFKVIVL